MSATYPPCIVDGRYVSRRDRNEDGSPDRQDSVICAECGYHEQESEAVYRDGEWLCRWCGKQLAE